MKKNIIVILSLLFCSSLFSQKKQMEPIVAPIRSYDYKIEMKEGKEVYEYRNDGNDLLNGLFIINVYEPDSTKYDIEIKENGLTRKTLKYDQPYSTFVNINVRKAGIFKEGYKHGLWKTTYENKLVKTENYNNGLMVGRYRVFNTNGDVLYKTTFGPQGNGKYKDYYYTTGTLKEEGNYENGKKQGEWCRFDEKGDLVETLHYNEGMPKKE